MADRAVRRIPRRLGVQGLVAGLLLLSTPLSAAAAKPGHGGGGGGGGGGSSTPTGSDVSYPQCGTSLPTGQAFGIVGVNGGVANDLNPCLGPSSSYPSYAQTELYWAVVSSTGTPTQPKASLYVNTGDPGNVYNNAPVADWPTSGSNTDGTCTTTTVTTSAGTSTVGANSPACAWQYGYNMAIQDVTWLASAAAAIAAQETAVPVAGTASSYPWWLDVETANTWQSGATGLAMNVADLQGMVTGLQATGATTVGVYSTSSQWDQITGGTTSASGSLYGLPDWIPGARNLSGAESNCTQSAFTGGAVPLTQWFGHPVDGDYAC